MTTTGGMKERIEAFARQLAEEFGEVDEDSAMSWLDAVENRAVEIGDAVAAELLRRKSADRVVADESSCPGCDRLGRYRGQREREVIGRRGPVAITEPEYYCPCCRKAFFPDDPSDRG
jgi:hypothetical protein